MLETKEQLMEERNAAEKEMMKISDRLDLADASQKKLEISEGEKANLIQQHVALFRLVRSLEKRIRAKN